MRNSNNLRTGFFVTIMAAVLAVCGITLAVPANAASVSSTHALKAASIVEGAGSGTTHMTAKPNASVVFWLENNNTGLCLDDSSAYGLRGFGCNSPSYNNGYQQFIAYSYTSNTWYLVDSATGDCVDDSSAYGLRHFACNTPSIANGYQAWYVNYTSGQGWWFQNVNTGLCIDDSSAYGLRGFGCNAPSRASGYQTWTSLV